MNKPLRDYFIPYLTLVILILIESKMTSKLPNTKMNFLSSKKESKTHKLEVYYLNSPHAVVYSLNTKSSSDLIDLNGFFSVGNSELLDSNTKIKILPKGEKIEIFKSKDKKYYLDYFRKEDLEGYMNSDEKSFEQEFSESPIPIEVHPLAAAFEDINQGKSSTVDICLPFIDSAFREFIKKETSASKKEIIKQRNEEFLNYQIANAKLQNNLQLLQSKLRESEKEMDQCFTFQINDLKYYFVAKNLYR